MVKSSSPTPTKKSGRAPAKGHTRKNLGKAVASTQPRRSRPRVFISYSHDSSEHEARALSLANRLRRNGIDAVIDQYEVSPPEGWTLWMELQIHKADFVIVICTESYLRRVKKEEARGIGLGACWEAHLIYQSLYEEGTMNWRFLPVLFRNGRLDHIPGPLRGYTRYWVGTGTGYNSLYRHLTGQRLAKKPPLGPLKRLA
jgi:hypothetical protein